MARRNGTWSGGRMMHTMLAFTDLGMDPIAVLAQQGDSRVVFVDLDADLVQAVCALTALDLPVREAIDLLADAYDFQD